MIEILNFHMPHDPSGIINMLTWGKIKNAENSCIIFLCRVDENKVQKISIYLKAIYYYLFKSYKTN